VSAMKIHGGEKTINKVFSTSPSRSPNTSAPTAGRPSMSATGSRVNAILDEASRRRCASSEARLPEEDVMLTTTFADLRLFWTVYDPLDLASGSIDVLGLQGGYIALADELLPGFTTVTTSPRYVSMLCAAVDAAGRRRLTPGVRSLACGKAVSTRSSPTSEPGRWPAGSRRRTRPSGTRRSMGCEASSTSAAG
jgi:hypothetical protein